MTLRSVVIRTVLLLALLAGASACRAGGAPITSRSTPTVRAGLRPAPTRRPAVLDQPAATAAAQLDETYGLTVAVTRACSDGEQTRVELSTELDLRMWGLAAADFNPNAGAYFETAWVFLENGRLFSATSSGERLPVEYDPLRRVVRVRQVQVYPGTPAPGSSLLVRAEVTLLNLPAAYRPPPAAKPVVRLEPGIFTVPRQFELPLRIEACR